MNETTATQFSFLNNLGSQRLRHSERTLMDHLLGTQTILIGWGVAKPVCNAGLFHAIYHLDRFEPGKEMPKRNEVRRLIGKDAEEIVWLWQRIKRSTLKDNLHANECRVLDKRTGERLSISRWQFEALVHLMIADALEQMPYRHFPSLLRSRAWLPLFFPVSCPQAAEDARDALTRYATPSRILVQFPTHLAHLIRTFRKP